MTILEFKFVLNMFFLKGFKHMKPTRIQR